jgi:hypothetical protein
VDALHDHRAVLVGQAVRDRDRSGAHGRALAEEPGERVDGVGGDDLEGRLVEFRQHVDGTMVRSTSRIASVVTTRVMSRRTAS